VLRVLCSTTELDEDGETLTVGDTVRRLAARNQGKYFGTDLDNVEWHFDRYAEYTRRDTANVTGQIVAIAAI
jgi:putative ribosome biogenesis GTPase RsgA